MKHGLLRATKPNNENGDCRFTFMAQKSESIKDKWFLDSCCSRHITNNNKYMVNYRKLKDIEIVSSASEGDGVRIIGIGDVNVKQIIDGKGKELLLKDVGYAPNCRTNLVSLSKAQRKGVDVLFKGGGTKLFAKYKSEIIMIGDSKTTGISELCGMEPTMEETNGISMYNAGNDDGMRLAHRRTCHTSVSTLNRMQETNAVHGLESIKSTKDVNGICEACVQGKATSTPHRRREKKTKRALELMHTDLCGPISPTGMNGERYIQLLVDDYSGAIFVSTMATKDSAGESTKIMVLHAQKLAGCKVSTVRPDNAKELKLGNAKRFLDQNGTLIEDVPPYSPESNGRAERSNRTILEKTRTILAELNMMYTFEDYKKLWPEAVQCVVHVYNRTLTKSTHKDVQNKTPFEIITGNKPDLSNLRIFGTRVEVLKPKAYRKSKVEAKTWAGFHLGYAPGDAYRCYIPELKRVFVSKDVTFMEKLTGRNDMISLEINDKSSETNRGEKDEKFVDIDNEGDSLSTARNIESSNEQTINPNKKRLPWISGEFDHEESDSDVESNNDEKAQLAFIMAETLSGNIGKDKPKSAQDAVLGTNKKEWASSMADEMMSLIDNKVFDIVRKPSNRKIVSCRWVYALKRNGSGDVYRFKSRLVAKGYSQTQGIDYDEVFAPVVRYDTLRFLMAYSARHDFELKHVDVKTAFLHGQLHEDIYMEVPEIPKMVMDELMKRAQERNIYDNNVLRNLHDGMKAKNENKVLKLNRSIYGLKQAAKEWHDKLKDVLIKSDCEQSTSDSCLFIANSKTESRSFVLVYVDDIIIAAPTFMECQQIESNLRKNFEMGPMEDVQCFLGMKIMRKRSSRMLSISQRAYIEKIARKFRMENSASSTPLRMDAKLQKASPESMAACNKPYRELVGSIMYLACTGRPEVMYASSYLARFLSCYNVSHWKEAKRVLRYLISTKGIGLCFGMNKDDITGYTDADWAGDDIERKSTSGYVFKYAGSSFSWSSKRQSIVAASTVEAEYISMSKCVREALWLRKLMSDFAMDVIPIPIYSDNTGAISLINGKKMNAATKHIDVAYHLARDYNDKNYVNIMYVPSVSNAADGMTKALGRTKFVLNRCALGLCLLNDCGLE